MACETLNRYCTMMYDRIEPLTPIKDPTVVSSGLSNIKPLDGRNRQNLDRIVLKRGSTFSDKGEAGIRIQHSDDNSYTNW